jgi:hypothetical protein
MKTVATLFQKAGREQTYLVGQVEGIRYFVFPNNAKRRPSDPDFLLCSDAADTARPSEERGVPPRTPAM